MYFPKSTKEVTHRSHFAFEFSRNTQTVYLLEFVATGPSGPVTEKSTGPDEKSLVRIF